VAHGTVRGLCGRRWKKCAIDAFVGKVQTFFSTKVFERSCPLKNGISPWKAGTDWGMEQFDIIFCRNVMMYLIPDAVRAVVARLTRALAPAGFLFLSHAETLRGLSRDFHLRHTHDTFYYQKREGVERSLNRLRRAPKPLLPIASLDISW